MIVLNFPYEHAKSVLNAALHYAIFWCALDETVLDRLHLLLIIITRGGVLEKGIGSFVTTQIYASLAVWASAWR